MPHDEVIRTSADIAGGCIASSTTFRYSAQFYASSGTLDIIHRPPTENRSCSPSSDKGPAVTKVEKPEGAASAVVSGPQEVKPGLTRNYALMLLMGTVIGGFGNWLGRAVPNPQDPPRPAVPPKVKVVNQVLRNPPDGKPFVVKIFGDPLQVATNVKFCVEAFPEVEWLGEPTFDNSWVEIKHVMRLKRERVAPTADCFEIGHLDKNQSHNKVPHEDQGFDPSFLGVAVQEFGRWLLV